MSQKNKTTCKCSDCGSEFAINKPTLSSLKQKKIKIQCKNCREPVLKMSANEVDAEIDHLANNFSESISISKKTIKKSAAELSKSGTNSSTKAGVSFIEKDSDDEQVDRHVSQTMFTPDKSAKQKSGVKGVPSSAPATATPRARTPKEIESAERRKGVELSGKPYRRANPISIYCNGGARCGYKIDYELPDEFVLSRENMPKKCCQPKSPARHKHEFRDPNSPKKCTICNQVISVANTHAFCERGFHDCGWHYMLCTVNGCILIDRHHELSPEQVEYLFYHYACPVCNHGLHGGVSSTYGIIFH